MKVDSVHWLHTAVAKIRLREDGIVHVEIQPSVEQRPEHAHENLRISMSFCERERRGLLVDLRGALPLEPDSRAVYSQRAIANHFYAIAMVINVDLISRIMANVYMQVARLPIRMKVFADFQAALDWLKAIEPKDR